MPGAKLKDKIGGLEARKSELLELVSESKEPIPLLHPNMAAIYRQRISALCESLGNEDRKVEAVEVLRTLVDQVTLVPEGNALAIVLRGEPRDHIGQKPRNIESAFLALARLGPG